MTKKYNIAIVGATGAVGQMMIQVLLERKFPINELYLLASNKSDGKKINILNKEFTVKALDGFDFSGIDIALFSAGSNISEKYAKEATNKNSIVIDNTSFFRYEEDIPLIVPEINANQITHYKKTGIIANLIVQLFKCLWQ